MENTFFILSFFSLSIFFLLIFLSIEREEKKTIWVDSYEWPGCCHSIFIHFVCRLTRIIIFINFFMTLKLSIVYLNNFKKKDKKKIEFGQISFNHKETDWFMMIKLREKTHEEMICKHEIKYCLFAHSDYLSRHVNKILHQNSPRIECSKAAAFTVLFFILLLPTNKSS